MLERIAVAELRNQLDFAGRAGHFGLEAEVNPLVRLDAQAEEIRL
ncbi:MAG: hypothetical protein U0703_03965 [Anaerolineae bacterium]